MSPERWRQVEDLYHAALDQTGDERLRLLAGADPEMRREVESLLAQPQIRPLSPPPYRNGLARLPRQIAARRH